VIDASTVMIREPARTGGLTIEINIDEAIPRLLADRRLMMQILINLLPNAVKFTEPGGRVGIHAWASEKNGFVIQISDTGIGIEPENIATAMAAFGQVDNSLGSKFEGTVATMRLPAHRIIR
ncbi:MAG: ATP-binding protein, partial [Alphaproteobacteria bacterium]|nr:ATP-binding protein [Alphaproteobacteria bacterium]